MTIFRTTTSTHDKELKIALTPHTSKQKTRSMALCRYNPVSIICVFALIFFTACGMFEDFEKYSKQQSESNQKPPALIYVFDPGMGEVYRSEDSGATFGEVPAYGTTSINPVSKFICDQYGRHIVQYSGAGNDFYYYSSKTSLPFMATASYSPRFFATDNQGNFYFDTNSPYLLYQWIPATNTEIDISTALSLTLSMPTTIICKPGSLFLFDQSSIYKIPTPISTSPSTVTGLSSLDKIEGASFLFATDGSANLLISYNGGTTFDTYSPPGWDIFMAITSDDTGRVYCLARNSAGPSDDYLIYTDDATTWSIGTKLPSNNPVSATSFVTDFNGSIYLVQDNKLYRSDDRGSSLQMVFDVNTVGITLTSPEIYTSRNQ